MPSIVSTRFGPLEYDEQKVVEFSDGILGFEQLRKYVLLDIKGAQFPFRWLQSVEDPALAFLLLDPTYVHPGYCPPVFAKDLAQLGLKEIGSAILACIVTVPSDPTLATANFQAPLVINVEKRIGKQVVTGHPSYKTRQAIFDGNRLHRKTG
jgi:flagellar assembly factor FliW